MSLFLPDASVLIALVDSDHEFNHAVFAWIASLGVSDEWLTCPITENGVVRIMSGRGYPNGPLPVADVVDAVESLRELGRHRFIGDTISITDSNHMHRRIQMSPQNG